MFNFAYDAGVAACYSWSEATPVAKPVSRDNVPTKIQGHYGDAESLRTEWQRGYDRGRTLRKHWINGYKAGKAGTWRNACPLESGHSTGRDQWMYGWHRGYQRFLHKKLAPILKAHGKLGKVARSVSYPDYDHIEGVEYRGSVTYSILKRSEVLNACIESLMDRWADGTTFPASVDEMVEMYTEAGDSEWGHVAVMTIAQAKKERDDEKFGRMEAAAQRFAAQCGKKMGTMAFLKALDEAVNGVKDRREQWNNPERRMEEWAAHMYAGGGNETYFDDLNFENGRFDGQLDDLSEVYSYIERKFPLLMMQYKERKLRKEKRTTT